MLIVEFFSGSIPNLNEFSIKAIRITSYNVCYTKLLRKRVGLARAIVLKPEIMLYDEPTTGVDPITAGVVNSLILRMREIYGMTSIVVTHDIESACRISDRIIIRITSYNVCYTKLLRMATFGAPLETGKDAYNAVNAAKQIQEYLVTYNDVRPDYLKDRISAGSYNFV